MNSSILRRVLGVLAIVFGLTLTLMGGSASAQVTDRDAPATASQAGTVSPYPSGPGIKQQDTLVRDAAQPSGGVSTQGAEICGYWLNRDSYYTHCGSNSIVIHVDFAFTSDREITVWPGRTNLSQHWALRNQGGWIYDAYCVQRC